jgi:hypothetical protein
VYVNTLLPELGVFGDSMGPLVRELSESESMVVTGLSPLETVVGDADLDPMLVGISEANVIFFLRDEVDAMFSMELNEEFLRMACSGCSSMGDINRSEDLLFSSCHLLLKCCTTS